MSSNKISKESFIKILSHLTPEEINKLIEEKGKKPKDVPLVTFYK